MLRTCKYGLQSSTDLRRLNLNCSARTSFDPAQKRTYGAEDVELLNSHD